MGMGIFNFFFITLPEIIASLGFGWIMNTLLGYSRMPEAPMNQQAQRSRGLKPRFPLPTSLWLGRRAPQLLSQPAVDRSHATRHERCRFRWESGPRGALDAGAATTASSLAARLGSGTVERTSLAIFPDS